MGRHIDESMLDRAAKLCFGDNGAEALRRTYNALHDEFMLGYRTALTDEGYEFDDEPSEEDVQVVEQHLADQAQISMDELWGSAHEKMGYE